MSNTYTSHPQAWAFGLDVIKSIRYQPDGFSVLVLYSSKTRHHIMSFLKLEQKHEQRLIELIREQKMNMFDAAIYVIYRPNVKLFGMFGPTNYRPHDVPEFAMIKHCLMQAGYEWTDSVVVAKDGFSSVRYGNVKA
jgi:hypothetical protein